MVNYGVLSKEELAEKRQELNELLEEILEERMLVLGQTNRHVPGVLVKKYEDELSEIRCKLDVIDCLLREERADD